MTGIFAFLGVLLTAVFGWFGAKVGAKANRDSAELTNRGEEWDRLFDRMENVYQREVGAAKHEIEKLQQQVGAQDSALKDHKTRLTRLEEEYGELKQEHSRLWSLFTLAMETLAGWLAWDRDGRKGVPPTVPDRLAEHLP
ncbi:hypothetical protein [Corynebacterium dentalis]|uniref:hypothetical protein n=1 Tax=Corynebacterium dentalis TaxID=2014528 RepID=UPI00289B16C8|nr:hypothetical protein [Corynebacterium dentalis]